MTDRDLVEMLDAGVARISAALGFAPGGADFDMMVDSIEQLRKSAAEKSRDDGPPALVEATVKVDDDLWIHLRAVGLLLMVALVLAAGVWFVFVGR